MSYCQTQRFNIQKNKKGSDSPKRLRKTDPSNGSNIVQIPHTDRKRGMTSFFHLKIWRHPPETVEVSGFFAAVSFSVPQCGCGGRIRTNDLRVMSCVWRLRRALLAAFCAFMSAFPEAVDTFILPTPLRIFPRMGQRVGQKKIA